MKKQIIEVNAKIIGAVSVVGHKEKEGPLGQCFDLYDKTDKFNQKTWEKAESEMQRLALTKVLSQTNLNQNDIDAIFAGDLLNQCVGSAYGLVDFDIPYFGLYGACSTAVEGLILSSLLISAGHFRKCAAISSSHFCSAEQQFRFPLEYGGQRSPTAQWTVTGSGAFIVGDNSCQGVRISMALPGIVVDKGINDASNMGAAMAPATISTLVRFFKESQTNPENYDAIFTGDLGLEGSKMLKDLIKIEGYNLGNNYNDCGNMIFDPEHQDVHSGGSGCGCSAVVLASYIIPKLINSEYKKVILVGTGAMMSPSSLKQGLSIPAIAHLIVLESENS